MAERRIGCSAWARRASVVALSTVVALGSSALPAVASDGPNPATPEVAAGEGGGGERIPDRYLVVFQRGTDLDHIREVQRMAVAKGGRIHAEYTQALKGFGATLPKAALTAVRADAAIRFVEPDRTLQVAATQTPVPSWGLDRVDQRPRRLDNRYGYEATGRGVTVFVVDTGIRSTHREFTGRIGTGYSVISDSRGTEDCNGHGTHTAATVGGRTFGVAKDVTLVPVRVLGCSGGGSAINLVDGIDWVVEQLTSLPRNAVINMSLGQDNGSAAIDAAVTAAVAAGIPVVAAAGNQGGNACTPSPARVGEVITVGATTADDQRASFSNAGSCVDVWAPGAAIRSADNASDSATFTLSGTSMAAPHVAGAAALHLERFPDATPAQVREAIVSTATSGVLSKIGSGSPNKLLYAPALGGLANRGPTSRGPVPALTGGQVTAAGAVPVRVTAADVFDPEGDKLGGSQLQVSRDGGNTWTDVALPSPRSTAATIRVPATKALRFRIRLTDAAGNLGDWVTGPTRSLAVRSQTSGARFPKAGKWKTARSSAALGGSVKQTSRKGGTATFTFTGTSASWIATMARNRGKAAVYVDGRRIAVIDLYSKSSTSRRTAFYVHGLKAGKHTVKIVALGTKRKAAKGQRIDVDGWASIS